MVINKQTQEAQMGQIFRLMLQGMTQLEIAQELNIGVRTVARYFQRIDKRYGDIQRKKTDDAIWTEAQLFKNRMLTLYKILETKAQDPKVTGTETAKCCEVAGDIATNILKMESEGLKAVREMVSNGTYYNNNNNGVQTKNDEYIKEYNPNRKF